MNRPLDVWDLGGVLVDVDFERFVERVLRLSPNADASYLRRVPTLRIKAALDRGQLSPEAFADTVLRESGALLEPAALLEAWGGIFTVRPDATAWLERLCTTHELWLLSDTDPVHIAHLDQEWPTMALWSRRLLSFERGRVKIDEGAFAPLTEQVDSGRVVRFFDDRADNVAAAREAGVPGWVFTTWEDWEAAHA